MKNLKNVIGTAIYTMPVQLVKAVIQHGIIHPSPYNRMFGGSFYNTPEKGWDYTPDRCLRLSDHWNFWSRGEKHCITNEEVIPNTWVLAQYNGSTGIYEVLEVFEKKPIRPTQYERITTIAERLYERKIIAYNKDFDERAAKRQALINDLLQGVEKLKLKMNLVDKMNHVIRLLPASGYKMGDLFTLTVGSEVVTLDNREYYSGRGTKYNSTVKHGYISEKMSKAELERRFKEVFEMRLKKAKIETSKNYIKKLAEFDKLNPMPVYPTYPQ